MPLQVVPTYIESIDSYSDEISKLKRMRLYCNALSLPEVMACMAADSEFSDQLHVSDRDGGDAKDSSGPSIKMGQKKSYSRVFKLQVVSFAESTSKNQASRRFDIDRKQVQRWCKQKERLEKLPEGRKRLHGGGRKVKNSALDQAIVDWVQCQLENNVLLTKSHIRVKAEQLHEQHSRSGSERCAFRASEGWVRAFMKRHSLTADRAHHIEKNGDGR